MEIDEVDCERQLMQNETQIRDMVLSSTPATSIPSFALDAEYLESRKKGDSGRYSFFEKYKIKGFPWIKNSLSHENWLDFLRVHQRDILDYMINENIILGIEEVDVFDENAEWLRETIEKFKDPEDSPGMYDSTIKFLINRSCESLNPMCLKMMLELPHFKEKLRDMNNDKDHPIIALASSVGKNLPATELLRAMEILNYLISQPEVKVDFISYCQETLLHVMASAGSVALYNILEDDGRIDSKFKTNGLPGRTCVEVAFHCNHMSIIEYHLSKYGLQETRKFFGDEREWNYLLRSMQFFIKKNNLDPSCPL